MFPPLAQALIDGYGWRTAYFVLGGLVLLFGMPLTALFVREINRAFDGRIDERKRLTVARSGNAVRAHFWILVADAVPGLDQRERRDHAPLAAADRSRYPAQAPRPWWHRRLGLASFGGG